MARIVVQSKKKSGIVGKLLFNTRGPYIVLDKSSFGAHNYRKYGKPTGLIKKFRTEYLYLLPPAVYPSKTCNTSDLRYLNDNFAPLYHPFAKDFNIEAYITRWFDSEPPQTPRKLTYRSSDTDIADNPTFPKAPPSPPPAILISSPALPTNIPNIPDNDALTSDNSSMPLSSPDVFDIDVPQYSDIHTPKALFDIFSASTDKLFFICYTPADI